MHKHSASTPTSATPLSHIAECPDLMVDGCLCDGERKLIFLSLWGRDTAVQEFLARLTLGSDQDQKGLDAFHVSSEHGESLPVIVGNVESLEKRSTRAFRRTLFGTLIHVWLFDRRCVKPDKANANAFAVLPKNAPNRTQRLWRLVQETSPLPLLDHWRDAVLELIQSRDMLSPLPFALGDLEGYRLAIDVPTLTSALGNLIRDDRLGLTHDEPTPGTALPRVA